MSEWQPGRGRSTTKHATHAKTELVTPAGSRATDHTSTTIEQIVAWKKSVKEKKWTTAAETDSTL